MTDIGLIFVTQYFVFVFAMRVTANQRLEVAFGDPFSQVSIPDFTLDEHLGVKRLQCYLVPAIDSSRNSVKLGFRHDIRHLERGFIDSSDASLAAALFESAT